MPISLLALILCVCTAQGGAAKVTILASPGPCGSLEQAAVNEEKVNFWDDDLRDDNGCTESFAALELRHFLARCLGIQEADIALQPGGSIPESGDVFLLGSRSSNPLLADARAAKANRTVPDTPGSFGLRVSSDRGRKIVIIEGADRVGTLYGTYALLEHIGMRFFGLGEPGTVYPSAPVRLPDSLDIVQGPKFLTRSFYAFAPRGNEAFFLWMVRNRMNLWFASEPKVHFLKKLGMMLSEGGHGIQEQFLSPQAEYPYNHARFQGDDNKPADPYPAGPEYLGDADGDGKLSYAEAHPEWCALRDGKRPRHPKDGLHANYCTSNPDATRELARNLVQALIDGPYRYADVIDLMMLDHCPWCECPRCQEAGTFTDRLLAVEHQVYLAIRAARREGRLNRDVRLTVPAYLETLAPPTKPLPADFDHANCRVTFFPVSRCYAHALADPACQEINEHTLRHYQGWASIPGFREHGSLCVGEYYNVSSIKSLPVLYTRIMSADIPWYYRTGVRHFQYMHTPTSLWGTWTLNQRLLACLLWDPDTEVSRLLDDYFERYYPTTAARTRRFYEYLEHATANIKAFKHHVWVGGDTYHCLPGKLDNIVKDPLPLQHLRYAPFHPPVNDAPDVVEIIEAMQQARREIDDALMECADDQERVRLLEDEHRFAYGESMFLFLYHLIRTNTFHHRGQVDAARREFLAVERQADRLRGMVDVVQVAFKHANAKDGLEASQAEPAYRFFEKKYGPAPESAPEPKSP